MLTSQSKDSDTKQAANEQHSTSAPTISLPKGGGAIRGIGEKFAANPVTGTASLSVPIFTTPSRADFSPKLSLAYDSGAGNGPFGFGWHLSVPAITRKTDKGLPRYHDEEASDVFILSDAEDLVPALLQSGSTWSKETFPAIQHGEPYTVQRYRPRVEGLFARIERWRNNRTGDVHWKSISRDNITSLYGQSTDSRIADPDDAARVFTWLLDMSYDDKGNVIIYEYKAEDPANVVPSLHEQHHTVTANRYLKYITYGNRAPYYPHDAAPQPVSLPTDWLFHVVCDYGEHDLQTPRVEQSATWPSRPDAFSSYRAGFEIRTYRLCQRVLMFHQVAELGTTPCLVRSTDFAYTTGPVASFLTSVTHTGYIRNTQDSTYEMQDARTGEMLSPKSLPPLEFTYTEVQVDENVHIIEATSLENLPTGVDGARYQWIDLDSEGLPGMLTEQADAWFYKRNLSNLPRDGNGVTARFEAMELVATKPSLADVRGGQQLMDLAGDGQLCLVQFGQPMSGYYARDEDGQWQPFTPFAFSPNIEWNTPNLKSIDLNGDGHADILITEDAVFTWYPSRAQEGFGPAETVRKAFDEDRGPALVFADGTQSVYLADCSGDGLTDMVRIRNGEVCYWPNLGYGRFGAKITMDNAPVFDYPDQFDQKRIRLADIDGSGTTDIIYLGRDKVALWFNQSGNSWSAPHELSQFPATDNLASVTVVDLLGNGTACLVWSSPLPGDARQPMRYIDLMGGQKPHLLISVKNNLGAETKVQYAASTRFYLQDRAAGTPWITKLPFPVHVVERVETYDDVSKTKFVSFYQYHHGYFDGVEREFRGFGMVEQFDTESFSKFSGAGLFTETPETAGEEFHLPSVHTKTWFHNGAYIAQDNISRHFEDEYYKGDPSATLLPDTILPGGLSAQEEREACRALKGRILRQEVYAEDNTPNSQHPYSATEHTYHLRLIQSLQSNRHAVFYAYDCEALAYHYERNPHDPRVSHQMTLEVDEFGNVLTSAAIGYPRRAAPDRKPEQEKTHITYTENRVTNKPRETDWYRIGLPIETRTYELSNVPRANTNAPKTQADMPYTADELLAAVANAAEIPYEATPNNNAAQKRLIERVRTLYLKDDLSAPLLLGEVESLALPYASYQMAFTPGLLDVYQSKISRADATTLLQGDGKYQDLDADGTLWMPSGQSFLSPVPHNPPVPIKQDPVFARQHYYLQQASQDPFGNISRVTPDTYDLLIARTEDALGNMVLAQSDYRVMQPSLVTDPNNNRAAVRFDALGMVIATAVMGKASQNEGDTLDDPTTRLEYDLFNWKKNRQPNYVRMLAREQHGAVNPRWQESFSYSDGSGHEIEKKIQAEPGQAPARDASGILKRGENNKPVFELTTSRWVGTGRTVVDNKGNPIKKYEPFFSSTPAYEDERDLVESGVTPILRYDPLSRLIRTDDPNGTFSKVEFDPWQQKTWDANDTVLESRWFADRQALPSANPERQAANLAAGHAGTPAIAHLDTLGRTFLTIADNGAAGKYETRVELDIEGNQRSVTDARGRKVMTYDYDMLGHKIHQVSMDAGERWMLSNVAGSAIRTWDSRDHQIRQEYDELHRPTRLFVQTGTGAEMLAERTVYGDSLNSGLTLAQAQAANLRSKPYQHYDGAGVVTSDGYDFKGNLLSSTRKLLQNYKDPINWSLAPSPALERETFTASTTYDALNRPVTLTTHDKSVIRPIYNEANFPERLNVSLRGAVTETAFVTNIDYDAKGQRELIEYGNGTRADNGVRTEYTYDPETFRLINLKTTRRTDNARLQDLSYTYDPVGNITEIRDDAQAPIYYNNAVVSPSAQYEYDALYRLIQAVGREHSGQTANNRPEDKPEYKPHYDFNDSTRLDVLHPNDGQAMRRYTEEYQYDEVGNILSLIHRASGGSWTRRYAYDPSNTVPKHNRLHSTSLPGDPDAGPYSAQYEYDSHGNMIKMLHLTQMDWDFKDQMHAVDLGGGGTAYYVYDSTRQRVRKVWEKSASLIEERIYLGGYEIFRRRNGNGSVTLERETLHIMDDKRRIALVETKTVDVSTPANTLLSTLTRYQFDNHLGSASLELDEQGAVISYEEYFPYGSTSYQAVRRGVEVSHKRYRYTGKERDEETGLYYHGARYYAPWLGRWTAADPGGLIDGSNVYQYARSNSITVSDPTGNQGQITIGEVTVVGRTPDQIAQNITEKTGVRAYDLAKAVGESPGPTTWGPLEAALEDSGLITPLEGSAPLDGRAAAPTTIRPTQTATQTPKDHWIMGRIILSESPDAMGFVPKYEQGAEWELNERQLNEDKITGMKSVAGFWAALSGVKGSATRGVGGPLPPLGEKMWSDPVSPPPSDPLAGLSSAEIDTAVNALGRSNRRLQAPSPGVPVGNPSGAPGVILNPETGKLQGSRFNISGDMMANEITSYTKTTVPGATGDVATQIRVHTADPNPSLSPSSNSASGNTLNIIQGGRRMADDGTFYQWSTADNALRNRMHIPIHRD
jgi:RHS repeat-associated protein